MNFTDIFTQISPDELCEENNLLSLVGKDFYAVTAGVSSHYNAMVGSGGGYGVFFKKPSVWCLFRQDRYTLELAEAHGFFTISYFPAEYKPRMMSLASGSGRDTDKMSHSGLTGVATPSGGMSFAEARLVVECRLTAVMTPSSDDFRSAEARAYIEEAYADANEHRRMVFGEIVGVWRH